MCSNSIYHVLKSGLNSNISKTVYSMYNTTVYSMYNTVLGKKPVNNNHYRKCSRALPIIPMGVQKNMIQDVVWKAATGSRKKGQEYRTICVIIVVQFPLGTFIFISGSQVNQSTYVVVICLVMSLHHIHHFECYTSVSNNYMITHLILSRLHLLQPKQA